MTSRFGLKRWLPAYVLIAVAGTSAGREPPLQKSADEADAKLPALLAAKPSKSAPDDDLMRTLLKGRYNAALGEARDWFEFEKLACLADVTDIRYGMWKRLTQAGLEVLDKPAEKIALLTDYLELTREVEKAEQLRYEAGRSSIGDLHRARYERLEAEIRLFRAKRQTDGAKRSGRSNGGLPEKSASASKSWLSLYLLATLAHNSAAQPRQRQEEPDEPKVKLPVLLSAKPLKPEPRDDELRKLLRARYNEALGSAKSVYTEFSNGRSGTDSLYESIQRVVQAGLEVSDLTAEKIELLTRYVETMTEIEKTIQARRALGRVRIGDVEQARYERLNAEIRLLRTKSEAKRAEAK